MKILLIEDDVQIGQSLMRILKDAAYSVDWIRMGEAGRAAIRDGSYTTILLDLTLPDLDGIELLRWMRAAGNETPVLIITARDDINLRVIGLDLGADDYVIKPFESVELLARIRAVVRRKSGFASATINTGRVLLDISTRQLTFEGHSAPLSAKEYALLVALLERPGAILSRQQLEERLYGWGEEVESNAIDVIIYAIRRKFGSAVIGNVRGLGWAIAPNKKI